MHTDLKAVERLGRNRSFLIYTCGNAVSLIGTWMQRVLTGWLAWELTGSGTWLGLVVAADLLPTVLIAPFAGAAADRWRRLTIARISQALGMVQALSVATLFAFDALGIELLFLLTTLHGIIAAVNQPARLALVHSLVGEEHLPIAIAINSVVFNVARLLGPIAAGVAIVWIGVGWGFFLNASGFAFFLLMLLLVRLVVPEDPKSEHSFMMQAREGIRYAYNNSGIRIAFALMTAIGLGVRPLTEMLPGYVDVAFGSDATGLLALTSSLALGAISGGVLMAGFPNRMKTSRSLLLNSTGVAVAMMVFVLVPTLVLSLPAFFAVGFFMVRTGISTQIYVQFSAHSSMRARVLSIHSMVQRGTPALGALILGLTSEYFGFRWPVMAGCVGMLICTGIVAAKRLI